MQLQLRALQLRETNKYLQTSVNFFLSFCAAALCPRNTPRPSQRGKCRAFLVNQRRR
jgi:hypothetical protein